MLCLKLFLPKVCVYVRDMFIFARLCFLASLSFVNMFVRHIDMESICYVTCYVTISNYVDSEMLFTFVQ